MPSNKEILFIHLGGLGDLCLSESILFSLSRCFKEPIIGLGTKRILDLFGEYFIRVDSIESAKWLFLFSDDQPGTIWHRIVFVGKDKAGALRKRWQRFSKAPLLFVEMYPERTFGETLGVRGGTLGNKTTNNRDEDEQLERQHVEVHQLAQLQKLGVETIRKEPLLRPGRRIILYPEKGYRKQKWDEGNFVQLYHSLRSKGLETYLLESPGLDLDLPARLILPELSQVRAFFEGGGIFVSNDSGMAHLAGMCGLRTITIFTDFDARTWHPRGVNISLQYGRDLIDVTSVERVILGICSSVPA